MTDKRKQIRVGLFAIISIALAAVVVIVFGGLTFWKHHDRYYVLFEDSVIGLDTGARVYFNGIEIGRVDDIRVAENDLGSVRVTLLVDEGTPIHADTHAYLSFAGITGLKIIDLRDGTFAAPRVPPGGTITAGEGTLDKLQKQAEMLADQTGRLMTRANEVIDGAKTLMTNLTDASRGIEAMVEDNRAAVHQSVLSVTTAANSTTRLMDQQVSGLVDNANALVGDLRGVIHGNEAGLQAATADLRQASRSFKELAREVRERPSRLLFSNPQPDRKLP